MDLNETAWHKASDIFAQYEKTGQNDALDEVIGLYRIGHGQMKDANDIPSQIAVLNSLGHALTRRYEASGDSSDFEEATRLLREALDLCDDAKDAAMTAIYLAYALRVDSEYRQTSTAIFEAVELGQTAVELSPLGSLEHAKAVLTLCHALVGIYYQTSSSDYLEEALLLARDGLDLCLHIDSVVSTAHYLLGLVLYHKAKLSGKAEELEEAEKEGLLVLSINRSGQADHAMALYLLSITAKLKYLRAGDIYQLDRAISFGKMTLGCYSPGHPRRPACLSNLGGYMFNRWVKLTDPEDLDTSILYAHDALDLCPIGHRNRWYSLNTLGVALCSRFQHFGSTHMEDFDTAAMLHREALQIDPRGHFRYNVSLFNLGDLLTVRYKYFGDIDDLQQAVACLRDILQLAETVYELRKEAVVLLANNLFYRYQRFDALDDLMEGIALLRSDISSQRVHRSTSLGILSKMLIARFEKLTDVADIDEAVVLSREAAELCENLVFLPDILCTLGIAYNQRWKLLSSEEDNASAQATFDRALGLYRAGHPNRAEFLFKRAELDIGQTPSFESLSMIDAALSDVNASAHSKLSGVLRVLNTIGGREIESWRAQPDEAKRLLDIYTNAVRLLPQVAYFGMHIESRLRALGQGGSTATMAIAYGAICGRLSQALEILEESRSVFWTQALRLRTAFDDLPNYMRDEMMTLSAVLEQESFLANNPASTTPKAKGIEEDWARRRKQSERFQILIDEARSLPGFERFLMPDEFATLQRAADRGPVIYLVASILSCDAVVLTPRGEIVRVRLDDLSVEWLERTRVAWNETIGHMRSAFREAERLQVTKRPAACRLGVSGETQSSILRDIWHKVAHPVLQALGLQRAAGRDRPRVWWCCSGAFTFLPIHAAHSGTECCSDYVVSSYTPSLSALLRAKRAYNPTRHEDTKVLLAATSHPVDSTGLSTLPQAIKEVNDIARIIPPASRIALPPGEDALSPAYAGGITTATFLNKVTNATIVHLACHGSQDAKNPLESAFILRDEPLSIARLMPMSLPNAGLAFLSACQTATGDTSYVEENIHLGAAMMFAGFKSVVGTMWNMDDVDGPAIARTVYQRLFEDHSEFLELDRVPYALDEAVRMLREQGLPPGRWATYIHLGL